MKSYQLKENRLTGCSLFLGLLLFISGCNEDKGNYTYQDINEITISGIEEEYTFLLGEMTDIKPELTFSLGYEDECTYEWLLLKRVGESEEPYLLATTKDLEIPIAGVLSTLESNSYCYRVTNEDTGIQYTRQFKIQVTSEISRGFLILNDVNNQTRLDLLGYLEPDLTFYKDIIGRTGSHMPVDGTPLDVITYTDSNSPTLSSPSHLRYAVIVLTDKGTWRLHPQTYDYDPLYSISYLIFTEDRDIFPHGHIAEKMASPGGNKAYLYSNGYWLFYSVNAYVYFNQPINTLETTLRNYKASPHIMYGNNNTILFNEDMQSFTSHEHYAYAAPNRYLYTSLISVQEDYFPYNDIQSKDLELIYMDGRYPVTTYSNTPGYIIFRNTKENTRFVARVDMGSFEQISFTRILGDDISRARFYAWNPTDKPGETNYLFLYYGTDEKIYELSFQQSGDGTMESKLVWEAPAGQKISFMKYLYCTVNDWGNYLVVGTYDPSDANGDKGKLHFLETTPFTGGLKTATYNDKEMVWDGFGKIVGVSYKSK